MISNKHTTIIPFLLIHDDAVGQMLDKNTRWLSGDICGIPPWGFNKNISQWIQPEALFFCCSDDGISRRPWGHLKLL